MSRTLGAVRRGRLAERGEHALDLGDRDVLAGPVVED